MPGAAGDIPPPTSPTPDPFQSEATVISLTSRRNAAPPAAAAQPSRTAHTTAPRPASDRVGDPTLTDLAVWVAGAFHEHDLSLADPETAAAYQITLAAVRTLLDGAQRLGKLDQDGETVHAYLGTVLDDLLHAPHLI